jgi:hypothetical protein
MNFVHSNKASTSAEHSVIVDYNLQAVTVQPPQNTEVTTRNRTVSDLCDSSNNM